MTHDELIEKIEDEISNCIGLMAGATLGEALKAVVELPMQFNKEMNIKIVNEQDPVLLAKIFYKAGYKNAMEKVIQAIEKELG